MPNNEKQKKMFEGTESFDFHLKRGANRHSKEHNFTSGTKNNFIQS